MEVLRINGSIPTVSFSDLVPGGLYTIEYSDILVIAAPHQVYAYIETSKPVIDIWNLLGNGNLI